MTGVSVAVLGALLIVGPEPTGPVEVQRPAALEVPEPTKTEPTEAEPPAPAPSEQASAEPEPEPAKPVKVVEPEVDAVEAVMPTAEPDPPPPELDAEDYDVDEVPMSLEELDTYHRDVDKARAMIGAGSVAAVTAALLFVGAGVEASKPECNFDLDDCDDPPRKRVAAGLGIAGGILTVAGASLLGVGIHRLRRLKAQPHFNGQSAGLTLRGRF